MWSQFCCDARLTDIKPDLQDFHKWFFSCFLNLQGQTAMKNLTLILGMSLGLFVLGTFANSEPYDQPKIMYKEKLPLYFKDNGELRCPGSSIKEGPRKALLTKRLLNRFGITVATRFQVICYFLRCHFYIK